MRAFSVLGSPTSSVFPQRSVLSEWPAISQKHKLIVLFEAQQSRT